ncbi:GAF domain protein [Nostoc sp. NIES-3756]|uniref:GAF domain-containing sensor histidine kinase n=1 Tax=Nostoc sp. NIES-3756 TaxID=1751286 RepID=UPI0007212298|nr:GAF domain-containing protein [Nostoc sp. NIES-3756]BAT53142.1 GAF domain protein [Nostoc sp. NIES-3756]BAY39132.1 GAF domain-containing protein [Nostoc sp. NIES-2111]
MLISTSQPKDTTQQTLLLEATASVANVLLTVRDFDQAVNMALQIIGMSLDTDRVCVIEHFEQPLELLPGWKILYEWHSSYTVPQISHHQVAQGTYQGITNWYDRIRQGQVLSYLLEEMPEPFRSGQAAIGVKALHVVPILIDGKCWGCVGFDDCREAKRRNADELTVLKTAALCIGSAIERQRMQESLLQAEKERAAELVKANEALQKRDRLLSVVAQVTKNSLETEDIDVAIPTALQAIGEVANMSRVQVILESQDQTTQKLYHCITYEWVAPGITPQINHPTMAVIENEHVEVMVKELCAGRSIWRIVEDLPEPIRDQFASIGIKSTGGVPLFIEGQYIGAVAFDDCVQYRHWSQQEIDVLTTAAEGIGAALHRKQLVEHLVSERSRASEKRLVELSQANTALKNSLDRLAAVSELDTFLSHIILEIQHQLNAQLAHLFLYDAPSHTLRLHLGFEADQVLPKDKLQNIDPFLEPIPADITRGWEILVQAKKPVEVGIWENAHPEYWHLALEWHRQRGHQKAMYIPLLLGEIPLGFLGLAFTHKTSFHPEEFELAQALAHQATLAIQLTQLAEQAKQTAVAYEQEKAAQVQLGQLAQANTVLKKTLDVLATEPEIERSLGHVLQVMTEQLESTSAALWFYNQETEKFSLHLVYLNGQILAAIPENVDQLAGHWVTRGKFPRDLSIKKHIRDRRPVIYHVDNSPEFSARFRQFMESLGVKTLLGVPLLIGAEVVGTFTVRFTTKRDLQAEELELIQALAHQATLAIQLLRMAEQAKQAAVAREQEKASQQQLKELARANESLRSCVSRLADELDSETFLEHLLLEASAQINSCAAALFLYQDLFDHVRVMKRYVREGQVVNIYKNPEFEPLTNPIPVNTCVFWESSLLKGEAVFFNLDDTDEEICPHINWHHTQGHRSIVLVPLILGSRPLGFIGFCFPEYRTKLPQNIELIMTLAQQATLAIHLTNLAEKSRQAAILEERNRMAREIHDTLAQAFTGVIVQLGAASRIVTDDLVEVQTHIIQARDLAREGLAEARRSLNALRPQILETANLPKAFNRLVSQMSASLDRQIICNIIGQIYPLSAEIENNLLRIGQEALTNALKHAIASEITIELVYEPTQFILRVKDNGQGLHTDSLSMVKGFGLMGIKERSDRIGAQLTIQSAPGQGTEIIILVRI